MCYMVYNMQPKSCVMLLTSLNVAPKRGNNAQNIVSFIVL